MIALVSNIRVFIRDNGYLTNYPEHSTVLPIGRSLIKSCSIGALNTVTYSDHTTLPEIGRACIRSCSLGIRLKINDEDDARHPTFTPLNDRSIVKSSSLAYGNYQGLTPREQHIERYKVYHSR